MCVCVCVCVCVCARARAYFCIIIPKRTQDKDREVKAILCYDFLFIINAHWAHKETHNTYTHIPAFFWYKLNRIKSGVVKGKPICFRSGSTRRFPFLMFAITIADSLSSHKILPEGRQAVAWTEDWRLWRQHACAPTHSHAQITDAYYICKEVIQIKSACARARESQRVCDRARCSSGMCPPGISGMQLMKRNHCARKRASGEQRATRDLQIALFTA